MTISATTTTAAGRVFKPIDVLCGFMGHSQRAAVKAGLAGEERAHFAEVLERLAGTITAMPKTYETEGQEEKTVHLHYFRGGMDWHIVERDVDADGEGQVQAFGYANLGDGPEIGYVSIPEIVRSGAELDFHFTPCAASSVLRGL